MRYFITDMGNIFNDEGVKVIMADGEPTFEAYVEFLNGNGTVESYQGIHPNELAEKQIGDEFQKYIKRQQDGIEAYLLISAELRMAKFGGIISDAAHKIIEKTLEPVRAEVVLGQWVGGLQKLEEIGSTIIGQTMYDDLYNRITTYITNNY